MDAHPPPPAAVLPFAPWVDATLANPAIAAIKPHDPMLGVEGLRWTAVIDVTDRRFSPINDHLRDLPPARIYQGGRDILLPDAEAFVKKAQAAGSEHTIKVFPNAFHFFVGLPVLAQVSRGLRRCSQGHVHAHRSMTVAQTNLGRSEAWVCARRTLLAAECPRSRC